MKILEVKKRNMFARTFGGIKHWKVTVQHDDGRVETKNCWASVNDPDVGSLCHSIDEEFGTNIFVKHLHGEYIEGIEKAELAVEGKTVSTVNNGNIVIQVGTTQNATNIAAQMRQQAQIASHLGIGIRRGK